MKSHTTSYNNIVLLNLYQCIFYRNLVVLILPQNMFKIFPHIVGLENSNFVKGRYEDVAVTINKVIFNLDWRLWIIIHLMDNFLNI